MARLHEYFDIKIPLALLYCRLLNTSRLLPVSTITKMKLQLPLFLLHVGVWSSASAFTPSQKVARTQMTTSSSSSLHAKHEEMIHDSSSNLDFQKSLAKAGTSFAAATTILATALFSDMAVAPAPALADVEISRGAFIIQTQTTSSKDQQSSSSIVKTEIDSKSLIKTLFANRKDLAASFGRMQSAISKELSTEPVWMELQKELLDIEGDVSSAVKITPPADWRQAVKDISSGKVNFLLNGEIVNVAVEPNFSDTEDDLVIRVKGFKGEGLPGTFYAAPEKSGPAVGPIRAKLEEYNAFWQWLDEPYGATIGGMQATKGGTILTGVAGSVGGVYLAAYAYHADQIEQETAASAAKQAKAATLQKKKKAEQAAAKNADVDNGEKVNAAKVQEVAKDGIISDKKEQAKKAEAGDNNVKKDARRGLRFWKKK